MGPLAVVDLKPLRGDRAQLGDRLEEMRVQHFGSVAAIEALDVGVLIRALGSRLLAARCGEPSLYLTLYVLDA